MGCCQSVEKITTPSDPLSKEKDATTQGTDRRHSAPPANNSSRSLPILEEESVKEVLPESANRPLSPVPPPHRAKANAAWLPPASFPKPDLQHPAPPTILSPAVDRVVKFNIPHETETSDVSEIHSVSESQRSTSTIPETIQNWGAHRKKSDQGPHSNPPWASPSKLIQPRSGASSNGTATVGRGGGSSNAGRGGGDRSYSSSPNSGSSRRLEGVRKPQDPRRPLLGHNGSRAGGSRNVPTTASALEDMPSGRIRSRSPAMRSNGERHHHSRSSEPTEGNSKEADSLDNPLVSLECFIFL